MLLEEDIFLRNSSAALFENGTHQALHHHEVVPSCAVGDRLSDISNQRGQVTAIGHE
jgi:hypothetical protein